MVTVNNLFQSTKLHCFHVIFVSRPYFTVIRSLVTELQEGAGTMCPWVLGLCAWRGTTSSSYRDAHVYVSREVGAATGRREDTDADLPSCFAARSVVPGNTSWLSLFNSFPSPQSLWVCSVEILTTQAFPLLKGSVKALCCTKGNMALFFFCVILWGLPRIPSIFRWRWCYCLSLRKDFLPLLTRKSEGISNDVVGSLFDLCSSVLWFFFHRD